MDVLHVLIKVHDIMLDNKIQWFFIAGMWKIM